MACCDCLYGILTGLTKSTDHPSKTEPRSTEQTVAVQIFALFEVIPLIPMALNQHTLDIRHGANV